MKRTVHGIVLTLLITSMSICMLNVLSGKAVPATMTYSDDFSSDSGMWEFLGSAYRDQVNQYLVLTEPVNDLGGVAFFNITSRTCFTANFSYRAGGGSGADGFAMFFYKQKYSSFGYGGTLAFNDLYANLTYKIIPGYGIEFDNWQNIERPGLIEHGDPSSNHIALIKDHAGNHLVSVDDARTEDNVWHDVSITVSESSIGVMVDEELVFQWNGTIDRTYDYFGFCSGTGSATNWHIIDNFSIKIQSSVPPTIASTIDTIPKELNLRSRGDWITAYIELPEGYNVNDINASTLLLNSTIHIDTETPTVVGDYDGDEVADLMVEFNRTQAINYILAQGIEFGNVTLALTGKLYDDTMFEGNDTVKVSALIGDVNCDGKVDILDLVQAATSYGSKDKLNWNPNANFAPSWDKIDILDLVTIISHYGEKYP